MGAGYVHGASSRASRLSAGDGLIRSDDLGADAVTLGDAAFELGAELDAVVRVSHNRLSHCRPPPGAQRKLLPPYVKSSNYFTLLA